MAITGARSDERIHEDILNELKWDYRVQPNEVGVAVKDGIATLTGWVDSYAKKMAAEDAARRVRGVRAVVNDIEVHLPGSAVKTDPEIAADARRAIDLNVLIPKDKIQVTVSQGVVRLEGDVEWNYQKDEAERVVRRLPGVKGVTNLIAVRPRVEPHELKRKIEDALVRNAQTDAERINVDVQGSKVVLTGMVHSWAEKREAERVAWMAPGVTSVDNRISVEVY
jgi:osmotically-inducible protein OsmY